MTNSYVYNDQMGPVVGRLSSRIYERSVNSCLQQLFNEMAKGAKKVQGRDGVTYVQQAIGRKFIFLGGAESYDCHEPT